MKKGKKRLIAAAIVIDGKVEVRGAGPIAAKLLEFFSKRAKHIKQNAVPVFDCEAIESGTK